MTLALVALACLALLLAPTVPAHGNDKCTPGALNSAEQHVENALQQAIRAVERYVAAADAGSPSADEKLEKAEEEIADYLAALDDLAAHQAACA